MAELRVKIPRELKANLEKFKIDVSPAVIRAVETELSRFVALKILASKSKLTHRDALELGELLKRSRVKKLKKAGLL